MVTPRREWLWRSWWMDMSDRNNDVQKPWESTKKTHKFQVNPQYNMINHCPIPSWSFPFISRYPWWYLSWFIHYTPQVKILRCPAPTLGFSTEARRCKPSTGSGRWCLGARAPGRIGQHFNPTKKTTFNGNSRILYQWEYGIIYGLYMD